MKRQHLFIFPLVVVLALVATSCRVWTYGHFPDSAGPEWQPGSTPAEDGSFTVRTDGGASFRFCAGFLNSGKAFGTAPLGGWDHCRHKIVNGKDKLTNANGVLSHGRADACYDNPGPVQECDGLETNYNYNPITGYSAFWRYNPTSVDGTRCIALEDCFTFWMSESGNFRWTSFTIASGLRDVSGCLVDIYGPSSRTIWDC